MENSIVVLSGGLDSTVALHLANGSTRIVQVLTFDYGQKAARQEVQAAKLIAQQYGLPQRTIVLNWLKDITDTALVAQSAAIPTLKPSELDDAVGRGQETARAVWVPNRNGVFINIAEIGRAHV